MCNDIDYKKIVDEVTENFPSFGGGKSRPTWGNPLVELLKDSPAQFAAGVDIESVVKFIAKRVMEYDC